MEPRKILIIKPSALGDVVHALPVLNLLRKRWPAAHIAWLITPAFAGLLAGHPQVDEVIPFERRWFGNGWRDPKAAAGFVQFALSLRRRQFDLVIDLQGLFRSGWLTWITGAPQRAGFAHAREGAWAFYNRRVDVGREEQHALERYLTVAESLGCARTPVEFPFATDDADRAAVAEMIGDSAPYAVLLPGTNWATKRWPAENFAELVTPLRERHGLRSIIAGGNDVVELAARIGGDALSLAGKTNLRQLTALLERASVVIANDSGPMHIASALNRPLVTVFGPTNPIRTGPYKRMETVVRLEIACSPCYSRKCSHTSCMQWLTAEMVIEAVEQKAEGRRQ